jgi:hypothetical protein
MNGNGNKIVTTGVPIHLAFGKQKNEWNGNCSPLKQSLESTYSSVDRSSSDNDSSDDISSWTDTDDSSNYSFDLAELEGDLSWVRSAAQKEVRKREKPKEISSSTLGKRTSLHKCWSIPNVHGNGMSENDTPVDLQVAAPTHHQSQSNSTNLTYGAVDADDDELTMAYVREELLKLGNTIIRSRKGDAFRERALVLASINYLARNVPCCVLDHLGREVRQAENRSLFQRQETPSTASCSDSSSRTSESTWDNSCYVIDEDNVSNCRTLTKIQSLDTQQGVILDLPYVAPFQGVVLFGKLKRFITTGTHDVLCVFCQSTLLGSRNYQQGLAPRSLRQF